MVIRDGLETVTELVDRIEVDGVVVDDVSLSRVADEDVAVDISVRLPDDGSTAAQCADATASGASVSVGCGSSEGARSSSEVAEGADSEGVSPGFGALSVRVGGSVAGTMTEELRAVEASRSERASRSEQGTGSGGGGLPDNPTASSSDDEPFTCRVPGCEESFETEHGMKIHATKAHQSADGSAPSPHRNPERLREVYEACETFEEMTEALGVDVTPQTVRRSMMRLGVHDPEAELGPESAAVPGREPAGESDGPGEPDEEDAVDVDALLPDAVDGGELVAAVRGASTLYEVQRRLEMEREEVQTLLAESGLLDLVHGRVATKGEREDGKAEIERRIVEHLGTPDDGEGDDGSDGGGGDGHDGGVDDPAGEPGGEQVRAD